MVRFSFFNSSKQEALLGECYLEESLLEYEAIYKRKQHTTKQQTKLRKQS